MPLGAILGELGAGKTLTLTWMGFRNFQKGRKIYSNYGLAFEYEPVNSTEDIGNMFQGMFLGDELWLWLDSRESKQKVNKIRSGILLKSRKRDLDILYTAQDFSQIDKRIRRVTDYIIIPQLMRNNQWCIVYYHSRLSYMTRQAPLRIMRFYCPQIWKMYDTREEINPID